MKKITIYILGVIVLCLASCVNLEDSFIPDNNRGMLSVMASVADLSTVNVGTKAVEESHVESLAMVIFDKNGKLLGRPVYIGDINSSFNIDTQHGNIVESTGVSIPLVVGEESDYDLSACSIYMVANAADFLMENITVDIPEGEENKHRTTEQEFLNITIPVQSIVIPVNGKLEKGIPMMGKSDSINLSKIASGATVANVTMRKLYAKVNVRFNVNAIQVADIPSFTIHEWAVHNVPNMVRLGEQDGETICAINTEAKPKAQNILEPKTSALVDGNTTIYHDPSSKDYFQFTFYVPEHKVQPDITFPYPSGIKPDEKQRYKPLLCSDAKNPMYVTVRGEYVDHNNIVKGVTYSLYLGQNNSDNFEVKRNQELNNFITIKGLTNNKAAAGTEEGESQFNISVDHRVDVNFDGFSLSIEREAILDSHFEVRPLDITLSPNSSMTITIPDDYQSWIAMEDDSTGLKTPTSAYITGKGVRKYFTTNLVSELNGKNKGTLTLENNNSENTAKHRVWIYIDENVNVYDKLLGVTGGVQSSPNDDTYEVGKNMYRLGKINVVYSGKETKNVSLNMQQWNLWRVWSADRKRYYDIEHEEEYLNNYASDQGYGQTQDGMPWGLNNIQLSSLYPSLVVKQNITGWFSGIIEAIKDYIGGDSMADLANTVFASSNDDIYHYDFYLSRDITSIMEGISGNTNNITNKLTIRDYSGYQMNKELANTLKTKYSNHQNGSNSDATIDKLLLNDIPKSAFAYCYNKNKRKDDGTVDIASIRWYLPAIDEIEDIAAGAYDEFDKVFQNKAYWSCQTAYELRGMNLSILREKIFSSGTSNEGTLTGNYFIDDKDRARATSVVVVLENGEQKVNTISSSAPGKLGTQYGQAVFNELGTRYIADESKLTNFVEANPPITEDDFKKDVAKGNLPRNKECRIRAVYRSGSVQ